MVNYVFAGAAVQISATRSEEDLNAVEEPVVVLVCAIASASARLSRSW